MTITRMRPPAPAVDVLAGAADRWQPHRCGVINAWQYDEETLQFHDGRLLLHGANGSGKTMLVEMLWPYLLDTGLQPARLSTGGTDRGTLANRITGYTTGQPRTAWLWAEFRRRGTTDTFTIGVRLRVSARGDAPDRAWFTTDQQVGVDVHLLDDDRRPVTADQLADQLAGHGRMWGGDEAGYRREVRTRLYAGHDDDSYTRMIDTILIARQKEITSRIARQTSTRAQARELSTLLSGAMPPPDAAEVARAAAGFDMLDRRRAALQDLRDQQTTLAGLRSAVRRSAQVQLHRIVDAATKARTEFDNVRGRETKAEQDHKTAAAARTRLAGDLDKAQNTLTDVRARLQALKETAAYRSAQELIALGDAVRQLATTVDTATAAVTRLTEAASTAKRNATGAARTATEATEQLTAALDDLDSALQQALLPTGDPAALDDDTTLTETRARVDRQLVNVTTVNKAVVAHRTAIATRDAAEEARDDATTNLETCDRALAGAATALHTATKTLAGDLDQWSATRTHVDVVWPDTLTDPLTDAVDAADPNAIDTAVATITRTIDRTIDAAVASRLAHIADRRQHVQQHRDAVAADLDAVDRDLTDLRAGTDTPPDPPAWRADRTGRPGTPLHLAVDFVDTDDPRNDIVETALDRAGLLDAWVDDTGVAHLDDITLRPHGPAGHPTTLAAILTVDPDAPTDTGRIADLLDRIAIVDTDADASDPAGDQVDSHVTSPAVVIGLDGSWRVGPTVGRVTARPARHIGAAARQRAREQAIAVAEHRRDTLTGQLADLDATLARLDGNAADVQADTADRPTVTLPAGTYRTAHVRRGDAAAARLTADTKVAAAEQEVADTQRHLARVASDTGLPTDPAQLTAAADGARNARHLLTTVADRRRQRDMAAEAHAEADSQHAAAAARVVVAEEELAGHTRAHRTKQVRLEQLKAVAGADADAVQAAADQHTATIAELEQVTIPALRGEQEVQIGRAAAAKATLAETTEARKAAEQVRDVAYRRVGAAVRCGLTDDAGTPGEHPTGTVTQARETVADLGRQLARSNVTSAGNALANARNALNDARYQAKDAIGRFAMDPQVQTVDGDIDVLRVIKDGRSLRVDEAEAELDRELRTAQEELGAAEEETFRVVFTGSLRTHLAERLRTATAMVDSMNEILAGIQTGASKVQVELRWKVDPAVADPDDVTAFRDLLLRANPTDAQRAAMTAFLSRRIDQLDAQAGDTADPGSWATRLMAILDYRHWHTFDVMVTSAHTTTATKFGTRGAGLSTGEHAIVLILPLLAAVAAHYLPRRDGTPSTCPRLLIMDEVFPTVDADNKRQLFGLMGALDLDWLMTSDKEWCTYDTVPGVAIHTVQKDGDASFTSRFVWDGQQTIAAPTTTATTATDTTGATGRPAGT